ncbi:MAG: GNAT family N-acetyltransferase [Candidatus Izemoplasmatales bacterium]
MELIVSKTNQDFLNLAGEYLNHYPERSQLLIVNTIMNKEGLLERKEFRGVVLEGKQIVCVFLNANPWNLQLYGETFHPQAVDLIIQKVIIDKIDFVGVQGNKEYTEYFIKKMDELVHLKFKLRIAMDIMRLDQLTPVDLKAKMEVATMDDIETITSFEMMFMKEALHETVLQSDQYERARKHIASNRLYKLVVNNEIVSIVMVSRELQGGRAISLVYTLEDYRNLGYSSTLVYQVCEQLLHQEHYDFVTLFVDKSNPVSNRVYLKVGFYISEANYDYVIA